MGFVTEGGSDQFSPCQSLSDISVTASALLNVLCVIVSKYLLTF